MRHFPSSPVAILERFVDDFYKKHPARHQEIDDFLRQYRCPDGGLQNDDDIMHGLRDLSKKWRRRTQPLSRRGSRR